MLVKIALYNLARAVKERRALPALAEPVAAPTIRDDESWTIFRSEYEALMEAVHAKNDEIEKLRARNEALEGQNKALIKSLAAQCNANALTVAVLAESSREQDNVIDELRDDVKEAKEENLTLMSQICQLNTDLKASDDKASYLVQVNDITTRKMYEVVGECDEAHEELDVLRPQVFRVKALESEVAKLNSELEIFRYHPDCPPTPSLVSDDDDDDCSLSSSPTIRAISPLSSPARDISAAGSGLSLKGSAGLGDSSQALISDAEFLAGVDVDGWLAELPSLGYTA